MVRSRKTIRSTGLKKLFAVLLVLILCANSFGAGASRYSGTSSAVGTGANRSTGLGGSSGYGTTAPGTIAPGAANPNVGSSAQYGTTPPTAYQSGLHTSPNPINQTSDYVVTGNVGGGKHFRGFLPYQSTTSFGTSGTALSSSTTLDSFLRRSGGSPYGNYTGETTPYFSQTATVTKILPGTASATGNSAFIERRSGESELNIGRDLYIENKSTGLEQGLSDAGRYNYIQKQYLAPTRPLSMTREDMEHHVRLEREKLLNNVIEQPDAFEEAQSPQDAAKAQKLQQKLQQVSEKIDNLEKNLMQDQQSFDPYEQSEQEVASGLRPDDAEYTSQSPEELMLNNANEQTDKLSALELSKLGVYEQMQYLVEDFQKEYMKTYLEESSGQSDSESSKEKEKTDEAGESTDTKSESEFETMLKAKLVFGEYETFVAEEQDRFNRTMQSAEMFMREGKFYRAADAYSLASIYKPDDPLPMAGKSLALFAAGEYLSSSLFLTRTLEMFPEYALFKVDIAKMVGGVDRLENRLEDVRFWVRTNKSGELEFLLGYVYYQTGKLNWAKGAIDSAAEKLPDSQAVRIVQKVIEKAVSTQF